MHADPPGRNGIEENEGAAAASTRSVREEVQDVKVGDIIDTALGAASAGASALSDVSAGDPGALARLSGPVSAMASVAVACAGTAL